MHEHSHEHEHNHEHTHLHSQNPWLEKVAFALSLCFFAAGLAPIFPSWLQISLFGLAVLLCGAGMFTDGIRSIFKLQLEENALMTIAVVAAFCLGEYPEACMVVLLFRIGEFLEEKALDRSKKNFESLSKIQPDTARLVDGGEERLVPAKELNPGQRIRILPGDRVPLNCIVLEGTSSADTAALTGESSPVFVEKGIKLLSGTINQEGVLLCEITDTLENSAASQILDMVYESSKNKGNTEKFITRFAHIYTPVIVICGVLLACLPPLFHLLTWEESLNRSLIFLVAACPCALVISVPLSFFSVIGALSKQGVLVKGTQYVETLSKLGCVALDKTGTVTDGHLEVESCTISKDVPEEKALSYIASIEQHSTHPLAKALQEYTNGYPVKELTDSKEFAGLGIAATIDGMRVLCGNKKLLEKHEIFTDLEATAFLVIDDAVAAWITTKERIPEENLSLAERLHKLGISCVALVSGDNAVSAQKVAKACQFDRVYPSLLPDGKVKCVERLKDEFSSVAFVGDGINDAPVLAGADVGISMGLGSQAANASSDIILVANHLCRLSYTISLARRGMGVVHFNIVFSLLVKFLVVILCAMGLAPMWMGVLADTGVTILAVLNAIRIFSFQLIDSKIAKKYHHQD